MVLIFSGLAYLAGYNVTSLFDLLIPSQKVHTFGVVNQDSVVNEFPEDYNLYFDESEVPESGKKPTAQKYCIASNFKHNR